MAVTLGYALLVFAGGMFSGLILNDKRVTFGVNIYSKKKNKENDKDKEALMPEIPEIDY